MTYPRVLPMAMAGTGLLLVLKVFGLLTAGGYVFAHREIQAPPVSVAGEVDPAFRPVAAADGKNIAVAGTDEDIVTGATESSEEPTKKVEDDKAAASPPVNGLSLPVNPPDKPVSPSERALLEKLQQRREELDTRNREMDVREALLKAMEIKLEERVNQLREMENQLQAATPAADEQAKAKEEAAKQQLKDLVIMYENMKPKEAARIFDQLDLRVLVSVVMEMNPRKSSEVIAKMTPASAQRLTVALAAQPVKTAAGNIAPDTLPKIGGER
jgi:flagellar motility protein MotE (MotC chaperone)